MRDGIGRIIGGYSGGRLIGISRRSGAPPAPAALGGTSAIGTLAVLVGSVLLGTIQLLRLILGCCGGSNGAALCGIPASAGLATAAAATPTALAASCALRAVIRALAAIVGALVGATARQPASGLLPRRLLGGRDRSRRDLGRLEDH
jgi:hypothetical protein